MGPLLYWILFSVLVTLLVIFLSCLTFNVVVDNCLVEQEVVSKHQRSDSEENCCLNKYHFDKHDVEDLTRIQGDFKTALPNVTLTNEVDQSRVDRLLKKKVQRQNALSNIVEEEGTKHTKDDIHSVSSVQSALSEENIPKESKVKANISQSVDNLEFCDPIAIDVLKRIHRMEEEAKKIDVSVDFFVGGINDLKYYEINEALLRLMISLCDITCDSDELRKKKAEVLEYIKDRQRKLKTKVTGVL